MNEDAYNKLASEAASAAVWFLSVSMGWLWWIYFPLVRETCYWLLCSSSIPSSLCSDVVPRNELIETCKESPHTNRQNGRRTVPICEVTESKLQGSVWPLVYAHIYRNQDMEEHPCLIWDLRVCPGKTSHVYTKISYAVYMHMYMTTAQIMKRIQQLVCPNRDMFDRKDITDVWSIITLCEWKANGEENVEWIVCFDLLVLLVLEVPQPRKRRTAV